MADLPLYLTEADVMTLVGIEDAIIAVKEAFQAEQEGWANLPRQRAGIGGGSYNLMGATYAARGVFGCKSYFARAEMARAHVLLYSVDPARLLAIIEADGLGQLRTGAASGVATSLLAVPEARVLGIVGAGKQAFAQVAAICAVRLINEVRVFSPTQERREGLVQKIAEELAVAATAVSSAEASVQGAQVVVTVTTARKPVCRSEWIANGTHINAAGANAADRRELDETLVKRANLLVTDDLAQARREAAEFIDLVAAGELEWNAVKSLADIICEGVEDRADRDITLFKSLGIALEDVALARLIHERALAAGVGSRY